MMDANVFLDLLESELSADFFAGVPDSLLRSLCDALVQRHGLGAAHVVAADEGGAVALAAGHYLATGRAGVAYMQNSGIGNAVNPLCSLTNELVYGIPVLLVVGWRGEPGVPDEPQHAFQGQVSEDLLRCVGLEVLVLGSDAGEAELVSWLRHVRSLFAEGKSAAVLVRKGALSNPRRVDYSSLAPSGRPLTRERAVGLVCSALPRDSVVVSTTGKLSRELFELRAGRGEGHARDFLTVGSMGHASMIALGVALARPERLVVILDGDGSVIMHAGALAVIGQRAPRNLVHVVINNAAHETVGGMPTASPIIDYVALARSLGYQSALRASDEEELSDALGSALASSGPTLLEVRCNLSSRPDLGRPDTPARENGRAFMRYLAEGRM